MDRIAKDVGDIQARLTDHRPVVQGELRYFVAEFEEKRGFRESRLLENLDKTVVETTEQVVPKCVESMKEQLCEVFERLEAANHMAQRIQQRELEAQEIWSLNVSLCGSTHLRGVKCPVASHAPKAPTCRSLQKDTSRTGRSSSRSRRCSRSRWTRSTRRQ
ncbi:biogenesis of lysosome-related organelles complex 1 subunit 5 isoform X1 [Scleropages formosus]|uniref:biogenesis of lysosome-related organelles complex 1 subunit 5 isoform X1 n=1 Tax=Scleropages formosus TaxID=113540 RepID=UPI000878E74C|nr:biogenesis of lysosome-related organelles complex 1 subunit 5 isoform X1 [Scleropages formosus]